MKTIRYITWRRKKLDEFKIPTGWEIIGLSQHDTNTTKVVIKLGYKAVNTSVGEDNEDKLHPNTQSDFNI